MNIQIKLNKQEQEPLANYQELVKDKINEMFHSSYFTTVDSRTLMAKCCANVDYNAAFGIIQMLIGLKHECKGYFRFGYDNPVEFISDDWKGTWERLQHLTPRYTVIIS